MLTIVVSAVEVDRVYKDTMISVDLFLRCFYGKWQVQSGALLSILTPYQSPFYLILNPTLILFSIKGEVREEIGS